MHQTAGALAALLLAAGAAPADTASGPPPDAPLGRLGDAVRPTGYRLDLTVMPDEPRFSGVADIEVTLAAASPVIWLHGNDLAVSAATYAPAGRAPVAGRWEQVDPTGVARLTFAAPLPAGRGRLHVEYTAPFRTNGEGLYHTTVEGEAYAYTQFESIDARRMFPGFDEPAFKVPFDITVTTRAANAVIGNAPVLREEAAGEGRRRVVFRTTRPLPTYLLALAVGPFDVVEWPALPPNAVRHRPLPLRGIATKGKGPLIRYALANTQPIVAYLEEYFGSEFPYPKLDLIASPEFGTGAMENAGAIVYGDARILLAPDAPLEQLRAFGVVHAHELAHQWFGDLVTPKWWDDTWLNESFANWMAYKAAGAWQPAFQFDVIPMLETLAALDLDSRVAARQIRQPVPTNLQIASSFDGITYLKGGAVLGMFENYLGPDRFRDGVRAHMRRFPYGVADLDDFMASLAQGSGRPDVVPAFRSFLEQPGVPVVSVTAACGAHGNAFDLAQLRYLPLGSRGDPRRTWEVPMCLRTGEGDAARSCTLLREARARLEVKSPACPSFVMPNANGGGYYRFALDAAGWRSLVAGFDRLGPREGLAAADSLAAAFRADGLSTADFVAAIGRIAASPSSAVALAPASDLVRLRDELAPPAYRDRVVALMARTYRPRLDAIGLDARPVDLATADAAAIDQALFRTNLVRFLALEARDAALRSALAERARRYVRFGPAVEGGRDPGLDESAVSPALAGIALQVGVQELGAPFVATLVERLAASSDARFRADVATALGSTDDRAVGEQVRALLLDPRLHGREPTALAFALAGRPSQRRATFDWFKANQQAFIARLSHFSHRWLPRFGAGFCSLAERDEVAAVFTPLLPALQGADRTLAEALEGIELCTALAEAKGAEVGAWFGAGAEPDPGVVAALEGYHAALTAHDVAAVERFVVADDSFLMVEGRYVNRGWADYRDNHLRGELDQLQEVRFRLDGWRVAVQGDEAWASFQFHIGAKRRPDQDFGSGRGSALLVRTPAGWKVRQLHTA